MQSPRLYMLKCFVLQKLFCSVHKQFDFRRAFVLVWWCFCPFVLKACAQGGLPGPSLRVRETGPAPGQLPNNQSCTFCMFFYTHVYLTSTSLVVLFRVQLTGNLSKGCGWTGAKQRRHCGRRGVFQRELWYSAFLCSPSALPGFL